MRIAIVGGPGVGKSTLVRQLGDLYQHGSYGEGEKGVWDARVLEDIEAGRNPVGVTAYFAWLYDANYRSAAAHDAADRVILLEGARITLEAHIVEYPTATHHELHRVLAVGDWWKPDRIIVLTSGTDTIEKHIRHRSRPHENVERMVERFRLIDAEFRRLAPRYANTVLIDRDGREFHERAGLESVIADAQLPPFREVRYEQLTRFEADADATARIGARAPRIDQLPASPSCPPSAFHHPSSAPKTNTPPAPAPVDGSGC